MTFVPIPRWKRWEKFAEQDGSKAPVAIFPGKRSWCRAHILEVLPIDQEAIIAVVRLNCVPRFDGTPEELDIGIIGNHGVGGFCESKPELWRKSLTALARVHHQNGKGVQ